MRVLTPLAWFVAGGVCTAFLGVVASVPRPTQPTPTFAVGDCAVLVDPKRERWESQVLVRVEEIGHQAYRMRFWFDRLGQWDDTGHSMSFRMATLYARAPCPRAQ